MLWAQVNLSTFFLRYYLELLEFARQIPSLIFRNNLTNVFWHLQRDTCSTSLEIRLQLLQNSSGISYGPQEAKRENKKKRRIFYLANYLKLIMANNTY